MKTKPIAGYDKTTFEAKVRECFSFLEAAGRMTFIGVRIAGGKDERDVSLVARYSRNDLRADIGWNEVEGSIAVLLRFERDDLAQRERYVYLEPFIEFLTHGETKALVPYVREGMSIKQLETVMDERANLLKEGIGVVIRALGERAESFLQQVESTSSDTIREYHRWMKSRS